MIYHYCSLDSFVKIVESKELWLSNSEKMNDRHESKWILPLIKEREPLIVDSLRGAGFDSLESLLSEISYTAYIACFSSHRDKLSQWRGYGDDGRGVCIGFDQNQLAIRRGLPMWNTGHESEITFDNCIYSKEVQESLLDKLFDKVRSEIETGPTDALSALLNLANRLLGYSAIFKNPAFKEEGETRVVWPTQFISFAPSTFEGGRKSQLLFRTTTRGICSYRVLNLSARFSSRLIPTITLGPKCPIGKEDSDLKSFLLLNRLFKTVVRESASGYR